VSDPDTHKADLKKASAQALKALHDLSEELPVGWEKILEVARFAYDSYRDLEALRAASKAAA